MPFVAKTRHAGASVSLRESRGEAAATGFRELSILRLNIVPSALSSDVEFVRRVYLDTVGLLPAIDETRDNRRSLSYSTGMMVCDEKNQNGFKL